MPGAAALRSHLQPLYTSRARSLARPMMRAAASRSCVRTCSSRAPQASPLTTPLTRNRDNVKSWACSLPIACAAAIRAPEQRFTNLLTGHARIFCKHSSHYQSRMQIHMSNKFSMHICAQPPCMSMCSYADDGGGGRPSNPEPPGDGEMKKVPGSSEDMEREAWELMRKATVTYCGSPCGTIAACDPNETSALNYDQVFIRDFVPSAIAFLLHGQHEIVRNFLLHTFELQSWEKTVDCFSPGQGLMPASFKVQMVPQENNGMEETLDPDFGEAAIGRVAPVDSGLWWIILLRAYGKSTGDLSLQTRVDVQTGIKMILKLCLYDGFDLFPTLLVTDGSCMIDRRMGIHGHPIEIQALFFSALRCAREMLKPEDELIEAIESRLVALSIHIRKYFWLDINKLNTIYRYKTEEYSYEAVNKFNIYPEQIPSWLVNWMPDRGGYLVGNLQPAHMDFRFFSLGNIWSIVCSLATSEQSDAILDLIEAKWTDLVGSMPLKICYPAMKTQEWRIITGSDPKNTAWSYHNGGSWPTLLWPLTVAAIKMNRSSIAKRAVEVAESRLANDKWPEYYDTPTGKLIGKQARLFQTWTIAGYLVSKQLLRNPHAFSILACDEFDHASLLEARLLRQAATPKRKRSAARKPTT